MLTRQSYGRLWLAAVGIILLPQIAAGDVLITKRGRRYEGTVTEDKESYLLTTTKGGKSSKLSFPKRVVKEVIKTKEAAEQFKKMVATSDLTSDSEVKKLAAYAEKAGLDAQREEMLSSAYAKRFSKADTNVDALRQLSHWCDSYGYGLRTESVACLRAVEKQEFPAKLALNGTHAIALARLSTLCREWRLQEEAAKAEAAALKIASDDKLVREELGYARDATSGTWVRTDSVWCIKVLESAIIPSYAEFDLRAGAAKGMKIVQIRIEMTSRFGDRGAHSEFLGGVLSGLLSKKIFLRSGLLSERIFQSAEADMKKIERSGKCSRLFLTSMANLKLPGAKGETAHVAFTSRPAGTGYTISSKLSVGYTVSSNRRVVWYVRAPGSTVMLVVPRKKTELALLFVVPAGTREATLRFCDCAPIKLTFKNLGDDS